MHREFKGMEVIPEYHAQDSRAVAKDIKSVKQSSNLVLISSPAMKTMRFLSSLSTTHLPARVGNLATSLADYTGHKSVYFPNQSYHAIMIDMLERCAVSCNALREAYR
jgi:hypothetical protein